MGPESEGMKRAVFAPLEGAELDCALAAIVRVGLEPRDFVLEERRTDQYLAGGHSLIHKLISVKRLTSGVQRQYGTGRGGGWPFEFERDLRRGIYEKGFPAAPGVSSGATS
jgi:hypothetical protein